MPAGLLEFVIVLIILGAVAYGVTRVPVIAGWVKDIINLVIIVIALVYSLRFLIGAVS